jgi:hypothetical protein
MSVRRIRPGSAPRRLRGYLLFMTSANNLYRIYMRRSAYSKRRLSAQRAGSMRRRSFISACLIVMAGLTAMITIGGISPAQAENNAISMRRAAERTSFSNEEIKDGLFKTAFRAELQFGRHEERIRKFDEAVRLFVDNHGAPARTADIAAIVEDIRARISNVRSQGRQCGDHLSADARFRADHPFPLWRECS